MSATENSATAVASAGGPSGPAFYIDGVIYRTVGTPTDLSSTDAPLHSFDTIYNFQMPGVLNVASAAPALREDSLESVGRV